MRRGFWIGYAVLMLISLFVGFVLYPVFCGAIAKISSDHFLGVKTGAREAFPPRPSNPTKLGDLHVRFSRAPDAPPRAG